MRLSEALALFELEYIALRGLSESTQENYRQAVISCIKAIGDINIEELSNQHVLKWRRSMEHNNKPGTIRCNLSKLKNIIIFTNKKGLSNFDTEDIHLPKVPPPLPKYLTAEEINKLTDAAWEIRDKCIIQFMFTSGLRAGELCSLERADISDTTVFIRKGKGMTSRTIFISDYSRTLLDAYLLTRNDNQPYAFLSHKNRSLQPASISKRLKLIAQRAGLEKSVHAHIMRHSFGTHLAKKGVDVLYIQRMMGHAFVNTTQIYVHLTNQDLQMAHKSVF